MSASQASQSQGAGPAATVPMTAFGGLFGALGDSLSASPHAPTKAAGAMFGALGTAFGAMGTVAQSPTFPAAAQFGASAITAVAIAAAVPLSGIAATAMGIAGAFGFGTIIGGLMAAAAVTAAAWAFSATGS